MNRNIEIKARIRTLGPLLASARAMSDCAPRVLNQADTFFRVDQGRLKLRRLSNAEGELIYYEREDRAEPKESYYAIARTADPDALERVLSAALRVRGVVRKRRTLLMRGRTRIHVDEVEDLGVFLELEVVLGDDEDPADGLRTATEILERLGIGNDALVAGAYIDLLESAEKGPDPGHP